jgi:hypothetical protein
MSCRATRAETADPPVEDAPFALCLTHDVDRPYKTYQSLYYAVRDRRPSHLRDLWPNRQPWWRFEDVMRLEDDLGVRSAFYFLREQHLFEERDPRDWVVPRSWVEHLGRYDPSSPAVVDAMRRLDGGGWEVGLHGSYAAHLDPERLRREKVRLEDALGRDVVGGRQHYLNLAIPETWRYHASAGLSYDASLGSSERYGFHHGYRELRPFDDEFVVFPLTVMDKALPDPGEDFDRARAACESLLSEARDNAAVMTALWHPRVFAEADFPGYRRLYRWLVERALDLGAWVGPPRELYRRLTAD